MTNTLFICDYTITKCCLDLIILISFMYPSIHSFGNCQKLPIIFGWYKINGFLTIFIYCIFRISVIFRVRSAKAVKITDAALLKRLGVICGCIGIGLLIRTVVAPPLVVVGRTADDLKAYLCKTDWWDHTFTSSTYLFIQEFRKERLRERKRGKERKRERIALSA